MKHFLFCLISVLLYVCAPNEYSYDYCVLANILYCGGVLFHFNSSYRTIISFEGLFSVSFWFVNFVYPVFYYLDRPTILFFSHPFNESVITKCTCLALVAYSFFLFGIRNSKLNVYGKGHFQLDTDVLKIRILENVSFATICFFVLYAFSGGLSVLDDMYSDGLSSRKGIYQYFNLFFQILVLVYSSMIVFERRKFQKKIHFVLLFGMLIPLLLVGSRTLFLYSVLILFFSHNEFFCRFNMMKIVPIALLGMIVMYAVLLNRSGLDVSQAVEYVNDYPFDVFIDLIINNRNLYVLYDYTQLEGVRFLKGHIADIFGILPGFANLVINFFYSAESILTLSSGGLTTYLEFGSDSVPVGLGTNMVGEAFSAFGIIGVMVIFFSIGKIISFLRKKARVSLYCYYLYCVFLSFPVFYPRASFLPNLRFFIWGLAILWLMTHYKICLRITQKGD